MSGADLDRADMRAIMQVRLNILFGLLDRNAQQGNEYAATRIRAQISGLLFLAEGIRLISEAEKTVYEEDSFRRCYHSYPSEQNRGATI